MFDEFAVAVNVGMEMAELAEQGAFSFGVAWVELAYFGVEEVVEEKRAILGAVVGGRGGVKSTSLLGFFAGNKSPPDIPGIGKDASLNCLMFARFAH